MINIQTRRRAKQLDQIPQGVETKNLFSVKAYAMKRKYSPQRIYQLIDEFIKGESVGFEAYKLCGDIFILTKPKKQQNGKPVS